MSRLYLGLLGLCVAIFSDLSAIGQSLANYLGTGSNPRIQLELSPSNGPGWGSYTIDYQGIGNMPYSSDPSKQWSPWNVKDTDGNYYGTITLNSDGNTITWNNYVGGNDGYYLEGIVLSYNSGISAYQLTCASIHGGGSSGPFPDAPLATPAVYPGTSTPIIFSVYNTSIMNNKGSPVLLKGVVRPSLEWNPQGQYLSLDDLQNMKDWGANVVRLDMNQNYWLQSADVSVKGSYKQIINAIVYYCIQMDMAVILDLHWTQNGSQSPMANQDSITFWQQVANDYKDFGTVIFELFNEPEGISNQVWLNGNSTYAGYQQLYNAVRNAGAQNICIANGLDYGYDLSFVNSNFKINGTNIVYGSHPYNEKGTPGWTGPGGSFDNNFMGVINMTPLIFTEFGVNQSSYFPTGYEAVYDRIISYADANKINYSGFAWWVEANEQQADVFPCIIQDWDGTPFNGGVQIKDDIDSNPGTPIDANRAPDPKRNRSRARNS